MIRWWCACGQMWVESHRPEILQSVADVVCPVCHTPWRPVPESQEVAHAG